MATGPTLTITHASTGISDGGLLEMCQENTYVVGFPVFSDTTVKDLNDLVRDDFLDTNYCDLGLDIDGALELLFGPYEGSDKILFDPALPEFPENDNDPQTWYHAWFVLSWG
jgi:hypothetical protein